MYFYLFLEIFDSCIQLLKSKSRGRNHTQKLGRAFPYRDEYQYDCVKYVIS